jgi:hypothetical protein
MKGIRRDRRIARSGVLKIDGTGKGAESRSRDYVCARARVSGIDTAVARSVSLKCSLLLADGAVNLNARNY